MDDTINTNFEDNKDELVIIVDEKNNFINYIRRKDMRLNNLWHRSSSIFVFTKIDNEYFIYIHKRSKIKDYCPSYYNIGFGGVLAKGETYLDNAIKELEEESGIKKKPEQLFELGVFKCDSEYIKSFAMSYITIIDPDFTTIPQPNEVEFITRHSIKEFENIFLKEKFTEISQGIYNHFKDKLTHESLEEIYKKIN
ncbi:nucleoside diphosphate hydrolase, putative [Plasmodium berghei]|uniref:Nucleoside diphosphate hydrolase, putative n=2 Tax=Plasmodium berghei TaxID=5821 RepID=A0A509AT65_PLABA|nr:nucleoside diphosphate hydrolase, putative [Plasmodium berghei ANKA]CXJ05010.1 nucleoside diphosphate hydrolase, putative [Plasmodium berghei]SCL98758.1 nucleoside diphosphate hydrolase, putative [Plasmodium berghei]SCM16892.1 nucleoside diphosphate hydrolase, putative [Plasmodium berghei]SCM18690.1 nucleoside diphosphate hydrolase, putative [Plasmodium berghei]SCN28125.1 nucleoside diphosphate hydrolase, putative [Plasmodium berghei]|eukprot:XP_034423775.1 nucleoside diphosphate hydrolase, putative [Plasmodium berghei ANKA]